MKILRYFTDWQQNEFRKKTNQFGGCGYYRTHKVAEQLQPEHEVTIWGKEWTSEFEKSGDNEIFFKDIFEKYDIFWTHYIDNPISFSWLRTAATFYGKKLVIDIDDNFLDVDPNNPATKKLDEKTRAFMSVILLEADAVTVSTFPLKQRLQEHFKTVHNREQNIFVVPNYNDVKDWNFIKPEDKGIVIGYAGSTSHADDINMVLPSIKKILEKYPNVGFQMMGQVNLKDAKKLFGNWSVKLRNRIFLIEPSHTFHQFTKLLKEQPWTIGIAPLIDSKFNQSKSHIKWLEYSMCGIPTVASRVYPYSNDIKGKNTIIDGETGLLCKDDEWVDKLSMLIESKELRDKLATNAFDYIVKEWQYKDAKKDILEVVKKIEDL